MQEAEMVFCTLSSTGRRSFGQMIGKFETVLVDEVAQATEVATLQALCRGCKRWAPLGVLSPPSISSTSQMRLSVEAQDYDQLAPMQPKRQNDQASRPAFMSDACQLYQLHS